MKLKDLKKGDFFTRKPIEAPKESQVYIKGEYDKASKTFSCYKFNDVNSEIFLKASKEVYTDFIF